MLNSSFLDSKWRNFKVTVMLNIKLVSVIFIYYNVFKFHVPRSISFRAIMEKHTWKHTQTHTDAHKVSDEFSVVAFCKNNAV